MAQNTRNNIVFFGGSSGVGLATAKLALTQLPNPNIIISSSNQSKLDTAVQEIKTAVPDSVILDSIVCDVSNVSTQFDDVEAALKKATAIFGGKVDHVVWTAGDLPVPGSERSNDDLVAIQAVRVWAPLTFLTLAKDYFNVNKNSSITITSGIRVYKPAPGRGRLTAASGSLDTTVRAMAFDLAPIRVNSVILGAIETPLLARIAPAGSDAAQALANQTLTKTVGTAEEAAEAYIYSMRCGYVTGSMIKVEGGALLL